MTPSETPIQYKGYSIQRDQRNPYGDAEFMFYPTEEGVQHDADLDGEDYKYCGNCRWASTLEEAIDEIHDLTLPKVEPLKPDYTPMSVTGSLEDLKVLHRAIHQSSLLMDLDNMEDAKKFRTLCKWSALVTQTIKDQQLESSLNPLPFPEK